MSSITNKIDGVEQQSAMWEFFELGVDEVLTCEKYTTGDWIWLPSSKAASIKSALAPVVDYGSERSHLSAVPTLENHPF